QFESVIGAGGIVAAGEAKLGKRRVEQIAGIVPGKRPPSAVCAAKSRREANNQEPCIAGSEGVDGSIEPAGLTLSPRLPKFHEPRTARAVAAGHPARARHLFVFEFVFDLDPLRSRAALQELRRVPWFSWFSWFPWLTHFSGLSHRPLGRIPTDLRLQLDDVDELIGLPAQLVGDHRRLRRYCRDDHDADAAPLHRFDQRTEIAVAGKQHHLVDMWSELHGIHGKF